MALDRNPGVMERPPRPAKARLLDAASLRFLVVSAAAKASVGVAIIASLPELGHSLLAA
jgi:Ca2+-transporting ATPase